MKKRSSGAQLSITLRYMIYSPLLAMDLESRREHGIEARQAIPPHSFPSFLLRAVLMRRRLDAQT